MSSLGKSSSILMAPIYFGWEWTNDWTKSIFARDSMEFNTWLGNRRILRFNLRWDFYSHWLIIFDFSGFQMLINLAALVIQDRWNCDRMILDLSEQYRKTELEHFFRRLSSVPVLTEIGISIEAQPTEVVIIPYQTSLVYSSKTAELLTSYSRSLLGSCVWHAFVDMR